MLLTRRQQTLRWQCGLAILAGILLATGRGTLCYSVQFGRLHEAAVPIYEFESYVDSAAGYLDLEYPPEDELNDFIINALLVFDERNVGPALLAEILQGGIGYNFTKLRLRPAGGAATVLIYGLPRQQLLTS